MLKLIIFDFDGVLYNASWKGLFEAYKVIISAGNKNWQDYFSDLQNFKKWWNPNWRENIKILEIPNENWVSELFYEKYNFYVYLFHWVDSVLSGLFDVYKLVLLTNRHIENTHSLLGSRQRYFELMIGAESVKNLKPNPEGVKFILKKMKVRPENTLMIGDMADDHLAGRAAGIKTGVVSWGLGDYEKLKLLRPDYKFKNPEDLYRLI